MPALQVYPRHFCIKLSFKVFVALTQAEFMSAILCLYHEENFSDKRKLGGRGES